MLRTAALLLLLSHSSAFAACSGANIDHASLQNALRKLTDANESIHEAQLNQKDSQTKIAAQKIFDVANSIGTYGRTIADLVYIYQGMKDASDKKLVDKVLSARATELSSYIPKDNLYIDGLTGYMSSAGVAAQAIALKGHINAIGDALASCK